MNRVITRIRGGLGNQLFCYAAARRLALANDAELIIDNITGFARDSQYRRQYGLDRFKIAARIATAKERLEPCERYRRGILKWLSRRRPFEKRRYLEQEGLDFDTRLLTLRVVGTLYLDGYWQSEGYFRDVEQTIREELRIIPPMDAQNLQMAVAIRDSNAIALHLRWFDERASMVGNNAFADYYQRAIDLMEGKIETPHYFVFSDDPEAAKAKLFVPNDRVFFVSHNRGEQNAFADLWLMAQCKHFIIANSTFSWWGAWLAEREGQTVVCPSIKITDRHSITAWNFAGQIPDRWIKL